MQTQGLTDLQVNGYAGIDFNDTALTAEALDHALSAMAAANVTTSTRVTSAPACATRNRPGSSSR